MVHVRRIGKRNVDRRALMIFYLFGSNFFYERGQSSYLIPRPTKAGTLHDYTSANSAAKH